MNTITDGSATFRVINKKLQTIFDLLYPLSSIYISGADNGIPPGKNEGLATWEELPADKVLQTASGGAGGMIKLAYRTSQEKHGYARFRQGMVLFGIIKAEP